MATQCPVCGSFAHSRSMRELVEILTCLSCEATWSNDANGLAVNVTHGKAPEPRPPEPT
jgi:ribosomal protein L37AE/L43A